MDVVQKWADRKILRIQESQLKLRHDRFFILWGPCHCFNHTCLDTSVLSTLITLLVPLYMTIHLLRSLTSILSMSTLLTYHKTSPPSPTPCHNCPVSWMSLLSELMTATMTFMSREHSCTSVVAGQQLLQPQSHQPRNIGIAAKRCGLQSVLLESTPEDVEESSGQSEDGDIYSTILSDSFVPSATQRMTTADRQSVQQ